MWGWWEGEGSTGRSPLAPTCTVVTLLPFWKKQFKHIQEKFHIFKMARCTLVHVLRIICKAEDILLLFYALLSSHNHTIPIQVPDSQLSPSVYHPEHTGLGAKSLSHKKNPKKPLKPNAIFSRSPNHLIWTRSIRKMQKKLWSIHYKSQWRDQRRVVQVPFKKIKILSWRAWRQHFVYVR